MPSSSGTTKLPAPDLAEHEEETVPLDDVLRQLLNAKPATKPPELASPDTPPSPSESYQHHAQNHHIDFVARSA